MRTLPRTCFFAFVLPLAGCAAQPDDPSAQTSEDLGGRTIQIASIALSIDAMEPEVPVEGRPVVVHFTATNRAFATRSGTVAATVSPAGAAPYAGIASWRVFSMARGETVHGVVAFDAPPAATANQLSIAFTDVGGTSPAASAARAFDASARFTFAIESVHVDNPRSPHVDSDYLGFAAYGGGRGLVFHDAISLGDAGANTALRGLADTTPADLVPDVHSITEGVVVMNWGSPLSPKPDLGEIGGIAVGIADGELTGVDVTAANPWWNLLLPGLSFADCDGPVVADRLDWTARQLVDATHPATTVVRPDPRLDAPSTPPNALFLSKHYGGSRSPAVCGEASNYDVTYAITRRAPDFDPELRISPALRQVHSTAQFAANADVDWSVDGGAANGWIDATGKYHLPASGSIAQDDVVVIRATSKDPSHRVAVAYVSYDPSTPTMTVPVGTFHF